MLLSVAIILYWLCTSVLLDGSVSRFVVHVSPQVISPQDIASKYGMNYVGPVSY